MRLLSSCCNAAMCDAVWSHYFFPRLASRKSTCFRTASLSANDQGSFFINPESQCCATSILRHLQNELRLCACICTTCAAFLPAVSWALRTDRIVLQHAQRLMSTWPLHCAVVSSHGHRDEAHHDGTRLRCSTLMSAQSVVLMLKLHRRVQWRLYAASSSVPPTDRHISMKPGRLRTFLGHGDVQMLLLLAKAVVMVNREVSVILGLGGRSLGQARPTNQTALKTATSPLPISPRRPSLHRKQPSSVASNCSRSIDVLYHGIKSWATPHFPTWLDCSHERATH